MKVHFLNLEVIIFICGRRQVGRFCCCELHQLCMLSASVVHERRGLLFEELLKNGSEDTASG
jgi:hypothetical protein